MSLRTANKEQSSFTTWNMEDLQSVVINAHWDELQDQGVAERIYRVVPLGFRRGSGSRYPEFLFCLIVASLRPAEDENRDDSCDVYQRIGLLRFDLWWKVRKGRAEEKEDHTHGTSPLDLLNILIPGSTPETIMII
jgi:hypothetical protein